MLVEPGYVITGLFYVLMVTNYVFKAFKYIISTYPGSTFTPINTLLGMW